MLSLDRLGDSEAVTRGNEFEVLSKECPDKDLLKTMEPLIYARSKS